ncbi:MAG: TetR/AcrR family transcriptional regulator [Micropruina sp.]
MTRRPRGQLRQEILEVVTQLLLDAGTPEGVSIDSVVDRVGCTPPALYYYFPTKADLLREACMLQYQRLAEDLNAASSEAPDPVGELRERGLALMRWARTHPALYRVLFMSVQADTMPGSKIWEQPGLDDLTVNIERGIAAGVLKPVDVSLTALSLWGLVHGYAAIAVSFPMIPMELLEGAFAVSGRPTMESLLV